MDSAIQLANRLVQRLRAFQQRQQAAREAWRGLIPEFQRQAEACAEVLQKALKPSKNGASPAIWAESPEPERLGPSLIVFLGPDNERTNEQSLAMALFYVDPYGCHVLADRKPAGASEQRPHDRSSYMKRPADLGDVQDISLGKLVADLLDFFEWALVREGKGSQLWQFTDPDSS